MEIAGKEVVMFRERHGVKMEKERKRERDGLTGTSWQRREKE